MTKRESTHADASFLRVGRLVAVKMSGSEEDRVATLSRIATE